jgi:hypothetical protein
MKRSTLKKLCSLGATLVIGFVPGIVVGMIMAIHFIGHGSITEIVRDIWGGAL